MWRNDVLCNDGIHMELSLEFFYPCFIFKGMKQFQEGTRARETLQVSE